MLLRIDPTSPQPLFEQLAGQVRTAVVSGDARSGDRLPSARDLAASLEVNQHTVLHAYQVLRDEGLLELRRGRGAVITAHAAERYEQLRRAISQVRDVARELNMPLSAVATMIDTPEEKR
ncbi:GntR family transcriptional regulator [Georgenia sp. SYP-B2076]|uniref:GntR family transcriptional regulator n=1 Tax=Georgenia sp. SYP-B2076 TaxID=2495881 RepID=UPI000F8F0ECD|nr:GntR family transcriptional regulator [Georgenia sp. SYP-B2076]